MKNLRLSAELVQIPRLCNPSCSTSPKPPLFVKPIKTVPHGKELKQRHTPSKFEISLNRPISLRQRALEKLVGEDAHSRIVIVGAVSVGILVMLSGLDEQKAWALGPEGPLVEEFWDNVRRYALYALTVSTGALYTILQPIFELLRNPISAIMIIAIFGGSIYLVSQVLSAMVGVSDFSYDYGY